MTERWADLHIHTFFSDSTSSPQEVITQAQACGLSCIAITDHDTVDGIMPTMSAAQPYNIEVIPAIELSSEIEGKDVHVLGYFIDYTNAELIRKLSVMQNTRGERMREMIDKLKGLGIANITFEEVSALAESDSVGRPHLATILREKGWVKNNQEAFNKYLADGAPANVPKYKQSPFEAIKLIKESGGIAVLAHPMLTKVDEHIAQLVEAGLGGLEVYYPNVSQTLIRFYEGLVRKYQILATGGSDAHGAVKKHTFIGKIKIPYTLVEKLKDACPV